MENTVFQRDPFKPYTGYANEGQGISIPPPPSLSNVVVVVLFVAMHTQKPKSKTKVFANFNAYLPASYSGKLAEEEQANIAMVIKGLRAAVECRDMLAANHYNSSVRNLMDLKTRFSTEQGIYCQILLVFTCHVVAFTAHGKPLRL